MCRTVELRTFQHPQLQLWRTGKVFRLVSLRCKICLNVPAEERVNIEQKLQSNTFLHPHKKFSTSISFDGPVQEMWKTGNFSLLNVISQILQLVRHWQRAFEKEMEILQLFYSNLGRNDTDQLYENERVEEETQNLFERFVAIDIGESKHTEDFQMPEEE
jgi:hypothetical protein